MLQPRAEMERASTSSRPSTSRYPPPPPVPRTSGTWAPARARADSRERLLPPSPATPAAAAPESSPEAAPWESGGDYMGDLMEDCCPVRVLRRPCTRPNKHTHGNSS